jgi:hypothetical protein
MQNNEHVVESRESQSSDDLRENRKQGKFPVGLNTAIGATKSVE